MRIFILTFHQIFFLTAGVFQYIIILGVTSAIKIPPQPTHSKMIDGAPILLFGNGMRPCQIRTPKWKEMPTWGDCSTLCGKGIQTKDLVCIVDIRNVGPILRSDSICKNISQPDRPTTRSCNIAECKDHYRWQVKQWSHCSRTCSNQGRRTREVTCMFTDTKGNVIPTSDVYCDASKRPISTERCNQLNCIPDQFPNKFRKCQYLKPCAEGKKFRSIKYMYLNMYGKYVETTLHAMRYAHRALGILSDSLLPVFQTCYNPDMDTPQCLNVTRLPPKIIGSDITVVQMRSANRLKLQVGQKAYVLRSTPIVVRCPVRNFHERNLVWVHNNQIYRNKGPIASRNDHAKVDRKGRLKIKKFEREDIGLWDCRAGSTKESISMQLRSPAKGTEDWWMRNDINQEKMVNDESMVPQRVEDQIEWVTHPWTSCSRTCGGEGIRKRIVRCERVDSRFYHILNDSTCSSQALPKPENIQKCHSPSECPKWVITNLKNDQCSDDCVQVGRGSLLANVTCVHLDRSISEKSCNLEDKPDLGCPNSNCQVKWLISAWSPCSVSCGGEGIRARHLTCVWDKSEKLAGSRCYTHKIKVPEVIQKCTAPPCKLQCIDLSPHCTKNKNLCKYRVYRHQCCKSCDF